MKHETILLTGGTGFLGSYILKNLVDKGYHVILVKRSFSNLIRIKEYQNRIRSYDSDIVPLETIFRENSIDKILHCATNYGRGENDPLQIIEANLLLPLKLIELGKKNKVKCFINTDTILDKQINYYSLSKKQFKDWLHAYKNDLVCINVALEHFFGPGDDRTKFVSYIVHELVNNVDMINLTPGNQKRDFIYIDDTVDAFMKIVESFDKKNNGYYEFEVGSNNTISIKEFVELAKRLSGNDRTVLNFGAVPYRENEIMDCNADISEISKLGWKCNIKLENGLKMMIEAEKKLNCDV
jgi:CDP-paratose synthetase